MGVFEGATDKDFIATAFYAYSTGLFVKAGNVLGRDMIEYEVSSKYRSGDQAARWI